MTIRANNGCSNISIISDLSQITHALTTSNLRTPAPGLATVLVPSTINPPPVWVAVPLPARLTVLSTLAGTSPVVVPLALTKLLVPVGLVPEIKLPSLFTVPAVMTPLMAPVQTAPEGQQATLLLASGLQMAALAQQRPGAPRLLQAGKSVGQVLLNWRLSRSCGGDGEVVLGRM